MKVQEFDAFALKSYSFALGKTNSFFSITTVILSILVLGAAVGLNYDSLNNLWIPREQLPVTTSTTFSYPDPLTQTLICYKSNDVGANTTVPSVRTWNQNGTILNFPFINSVNATKQYPYLGKNIKTAFGCIDITGIEFSSINNHLFIEVAAANASIYYPTLTTTNIVYQTEMAFAQVWSNSPKKGLNFSAVIYPSFIEAQVSDSIYIGAAPVTISTIASGVTISSIYNRLSTISSTYAKFDFQVVFLKQYPVVTTVTMTRENIGYIVGAILSWISIFTMILGFIISPLMDKSLSLIQTESLFHIPEQYRKPSIIKYTLACIKSGIFTKEDKYVKLDEELEKLKNVGCALKVQKTLRRLCPPAPKLMQNEVIAAEHNFDEPETDDFGVEIFSQNGKYSAAEFDVAEDEENVNILSKVRKAFFYWLDSGSDNVSVNYADGGHGSKESFCLSFVFVAGFLAFLVLFGVFQFNTSTVTYNQVNTQDLNYTFVPAEVGVVTYYTANISAKIVDGNFKVIENLTMIEDANCSSYAVANSLMYNLIQSSQIGDKFYHCFTEPITIVSSLIPENVRTLYVSSLADNLYGPFHAQTNPDDFNLIDSFYNYYPENYDCYTPYGGLYHVVSVQAITTIENGNVIDQTSQFTSTQQLSNNLNNLCGTYITMTSSETIIETSTSSIFDVVQNIWGFAIICFTVILMKATKYINLRQKQKTVSPEKAEFRDSLCIYLSKLNGLLAGRHKGELERAKYYIKEPLNQHSEG